MVFLFFPTCHISGYVYGLCFDFPLGQWFISINWDGLEIRIPNLIVTLYYAQLFPLAWIRIPVQIVSQMVTVPILGTDLRPRDPNPNPSPLVEMRDKAPSVV